MYTNKLPKDLERKINYQQGAGQERVGRQSKTKKKSDERHRKSHRAEEGKQGRAGHDQSGPQSTLWGPQHPCRARWKTELDRPAATVTCATCARVCRPVGPDVACTPTGRGFSRAARLTFWSGEPLVGPFWLPQGGEQCPCPLLTTC